MKKESGLSIIGIFFIIIIMIVCIYIVGVKVFGKNGMFDQLKEADNEFNKSEIVDSLNLVIKEKYIFNYKYATENDLKPEEVCTQENLFNFLLDDNYIEPLKDINDNLVEDQYYINADSLKGDVAISVINENGSESNGTKIYKIKKIENTFLIYFVDKYGEEEELGELIINPEKIKEEVK